MAAVQALDYEAMGEVALVACVLGGDADAVRLITTRNNQRLYRAAWSILRNRAEAEDVVQEAYLRAFAALSGFKGESALSTWLTRIVINEALTRRRAAKRRQAAATERGAAFIEDYREAFMQGSNQAQSPEKTAMRGQIAKLLEQAIDRLPEMFRLVFVLREIEELSVEETAAVLQIPEQTVKTRLFRAKRRLQLELDPELHGALAETFRFAGADCEAMTAGVLQRLGLT